MTLAPHSSAFYCPNNLSVSLGMLLAMQRAGESAHTWALEFRSVCSLCLLQRLMPRHDQKFTDVVTSVLPLGGTRTRKSQWMSPWALKTSHLPHKNIPH